RISHRCLGRGGSWIPRLLEAQNGPCPRAHLGIRGGCRSPHNYCWNYPQGNRHLRWNRADSQSGWWRSNSRSNQVKERRRTVTSEKPKFDKDIELLKISLVSEEIRTAYFNFNAIYFS